MSQGLGLRALLFFFSLFLAYQYSWKTHTLASLYFLPSHNHKPSLQPQSAFGSCDTERMACGKMCWQVPYRPHPAIAYVKNLMPDSSCCVEAAQYHTNQSCLILSFPFPVSTCCFLFLFIFFSLSFFLHLGLRTEMLWGRDHPFVPCFCLLPRSLLAWHKSNANSKAK